jgi:hypothetical protein
MGARAGLRLERVVQFGSGAIWLVGVVLAGALLDVRLHARVPAAGGPLVPFDPAVQTPVSPMQHRPPPAPPPKMQDKGGKGVEYSPWEHVPT